MRLPSLRAWPFPVVAGEEAYQEFTAGTIPVRRVMAEDPASLVLVEHERGFMPVFDEHLGAVRRAEAATENVDYVATWTGMTGDATRPTVIRLELKIDGLRARPRLLDDALVAVRRRRVGRLGAPSQRRRTLVLAGRHLGARPDPRPRRPASSPDPGRGASPGDAPATAVSATPVLAESRETPARRRQIACARSATPSTGRDASRHRETKLKGDDHA
jgi:hypothetical protein